MNIQQKYIKRCIQLAKNGLGTTFPNPLVGSVIVYNDKIIGEGWHKKSGEPHAEVNAVNSVKDKSLLKNSTIYVSLEPCSHFGKTPPCADLIINSGIPNIVIGTLDPNIKVAGNGVKKLIEAGRNVTIGILENECNELNKRFFTFQQKKRPYIILKWAESKDGYIAPLYKEEQKPVWITNEFSRQLVHKWRSDEDAILVGCQTVIDDNPKLTIRDWSGINPTRIVLDQNNRISKESYIFENQATTFLLTNNEINYCKNTTEQVVEFAFENNLQSIIIEGGAHTLQTFIDNNIWDEARIFIGNVFLRNGKKAPILNSKLSKNVSILEDELLILKNND